MGLLAMVMGYESMGYGSMGLWVYGLQSNCMGYRLWVYNVVTSIGGPMIIVRLLVLYSRVQDTPTPIPSTPTPPYHNVPKLPAHHP
jgi:hypothetical protein